MKTGKEKKKLNKFLAANLSLILCLSSVPTSYAVVSAAEDEDTDDKYSVKVNDLFSKEVQDAAVNLSVYSSETSESIAEFPVATDENGLAEFDKNQVLNTIQEYKASNTEEISDETYTLVFTAEKENYYQDASEPISLEDFCNSFELGLELAEKCNIVGTVDFIGANLSIIDPVYSVDYSLPGRNIEKYLKDGETIQDLEIEYDANKIDFTIKDAPLAPDFEVTVIPDENFIVDTSKEEGEFEFYKMTTKTVHLESKADLSSVAVRVEPDAKKLVFPEDSTLGTFKDADKNIVLGELYLPKETAEYRFRYETPIGCSLNEFTLVSDQDTSLSYSEEDDLYTLFLNNSAIYEIVPELSDSEAPEIEFKFKNEDDYVNSQSIQVSVNDNLSKTVHVTLVQLFKGEFDALTPGEGETQKWTGEDLTFSIPENGLYLLYARDEAGNIQYLSMDDQEIDANTIRPSFEVKNIDTVKPVLDDGQPVITRKTDILGRITYTVSFSVIDPESDETGTSAVSGIGSVTYTVQDGRAEKPVILEPDTEGKYSFKISEDYIHKCVIEARDNAGNILRFSPMNKPYLDLEIENENIWANSKKISYKLNIPETVNGEEPETKEEVEDENKLYTVEIKNKKGEQILFLSEVGPEGFVEFSKDSSEQGADYVFVLTNNKEKDDPTYIELTEKIHISKVDCNPPKQTWLDVQDKVPVSKGFISFVATDSGSGLKGFNVTRTDSENNEFSFFVPAEDALSNAESNIYHINLPADEEISSAPVSDGTYQYRVVAEDNVGNKTIYNGTKEDNEIAPVDVIYDLTGPKITDITFKDNKKWFFVNKTEVSFKAEDIAPGGEENSNNQYGVAKCSVQLTDPEGNVIKKWMDVTKPKNDQKYKVEIDPGFKGYIHIKAVDHAGNETVVIANGPDAPAIDVVNEEDITPELDISIYDHRLASEIEHTSDSDVYPPESYYCTNGFDLTLNASLPQPLSKIQKITVVQKGEGGNGDIPIYDESVDSATLKFVRQDLIQEPGDTSFIIIPKGKSKITLEISVTTKHGNSITKTINVNWDSTPPGVTANNEVAKTTRENLQSAGNQHIFVIEEKQSSIELCSILFNGSFYYKTATGIVEVPVGRNETDENSENKYSLDQVLDFKQGSTKFSLDSDGKHLCINEIDPFACMNEKLKQLLEDEDAVPGQYGFKGSIGISTKDAAYNEYSWDRKLENSKDNKAVLSEVIVDRIEPIAPEIDATVLNDGITQDYNEGEWVNKQITLNAHSEHIPSGIRKIVVKRTNSFETEENVDDSLVTVAEGDPGKVTTTVENDYKGYYSFAVESTVGNVSEDKIIEVKQDLTSPENLTVKSNGTELNISESSKIVFDTFFNTAQNITFSADWNISGRSEKDDAESFAEVKNTNEQPGKNSWRKLGFGEVIRFEPNKRFVLYYNTKDNAGNESQVHTTGVVLDNQKPVGINNPNGVDINLPAANSNGFYNGSIDVGVDVVDPSYSGTERDEKAGVYSGLSKVTYRIYATDTGALKTGTLFDANDSEHEGCTITAEENTSNLIKSMNSNVRIDAETFNSNNVIFEVTAVDNAGNETVTSTNVGDIKIDITAPAIDVSYNNNDSKNDHYFSEDRTATITVTERNFDPEDFKLSITNTDGTIPELSAWSTNEADSNGDGTTHTATVTFNIDGDYTFGAEYTDLAGNQAGSVNYAAGTANPTEFTIDKTIPVIEVTYDSTVENAYYNKARTATITVKEHNFDSSKVDIKIKAEKEQLGSSDPITVNPPSMSSWSTNSGADTHVMTIEYAEDADYTFDIKMADLAENENDQIPQDVFHVDKQFEDFKVLVRFGSNETDPQNSVHVNDTENNTPTNGHAYQQIERGIAVEFSDINLDTEGKDVNLSQKSRGKNAEGLEPAEVNNTDKTMQVNYSIAPDRANDGIYRLTAKAEDLAKNSKETTLSFSISKYGSFYMYDDQLEKFQSPENKYVDSISKDLKITEYNPSGIKENASKVILTRDNNNVDLVKNSEDSELLLSKPVTLEKTEDGHYNTESGWYEHEYFIPKDNFLQEGLYGVTITSTDEAGTVSQNDQDVENVINNDLEPTIKFYVDKNKPVLDYVTGLEESYILSDKQDVNYSVSDTIGLKSVEVYLTDLDSKNKELVDKIDLTGTNPEESETSETDASSKLNDRKYEGTVTISESGARQKLSFVVTDKAGHVFSTDDMTEDELNASGFGSIFEFTLSSNWWDLFYNNKPVFYGTWAGIVAVIGGIIFYFFFKNRKDEEEEEQDTAAI